MYKNILIAIDGSEHSYKALDQGLKLGKSFGSNLHILSVTPEDQIISMGSGVYSDQMVEEITKAHEESLHDVRETTADYPNEINYVHRLGKVDREILSYAKLNNITLIIIGNRGLGGISRTLLGSISTKIVNTSDISVLVVK